MDKRSIKNKGGSIVYKLEKKGNVFYQTWSDIFSEDEITKWIAESEKALAGIGGKPFCVFADLRKLKPLTPQAGALVAKGQEMYKKAGMERSVVILSDAITTMQFRRLAKQSGIDAWERYIDASKTPDFQKVGMDWLMFKTEPQQ